MQTTPRPWLPMVMVATICTLLFALIAVLVTVAPAATAAPPIGIVATPTAALEPTPAGLARPINAYGAPNMGTFIGPVEAGRAYTVVARSPDFGWLQLDVVGSGLVWTPVESVDGVDVNALRAVAPPAPTQPPVAQQPAEPDTVIVYRAAPTASPETIIVVATAILPDTPRAGQPMTYDEQQATAQTAAAGHERESDKPSPDWHAPLKTDQSDSCGGADVAAPLCH